MGKREDIICTSCTLFYCLDKPFNVGNMLFRATYVELRLEMFRDISTKAVKFAVANYMRNFETTLEIEGVYFY